MDVSYRKAFGFAVALHLILFIIFFSNLFLWETVKKQVAASNTPVIQATAIPAEALEEELERLNKIDEQRLEKEEQRQELLEQQAKAAEQKRVEEEKKLADVKVQAEQEKTKEAKAEQERKDQAKAQVEAEQAKLALLEEQRIVEEKKLADLQVKKAAEEAKQKEAKQKAEAEAKKKAEQQQKLAAEKKIQDEKKKQEAAVAEAKRQEEKKKQEAAAAEAKRQQELAAQQQAQLAGQINAEVDKYVALVQQKVTQNWEVLQGSVAPGIFTRVMVRLAPDGAVLDVVVEQTSGNAILDRSAVAAVYRASPLPVPSGEAFERFRELRLTLRPDQIVSQR